MIRWMDTLGRELRQAFRRLSRRPGFAVVSICTLALGIGASTAVFSVFQSVVLRPLPYPQPDRLVTLDETFEGVPGVADGTRIWASYRSYVTWERQARSFVGIAGMQGGRAIIEADDAARSVSSARVSPNYFSVLGLEPLLGRAFREEEIVGRAAPVVILSEGMWRQSFASDPDVIGSRIFMDGESKEVIGVMPDGYRNTYTGGAQVWVPLYVDEARWLGSDARWLRLVGRLHEGRSLDDATRELVGLQAGLEAEFPDTHANKGAIVRDLHSVLVRNVDTRLKLLLAAVGFVLLIATINVGSLLFARSLERAQEWQLRAALGANRVRNLWTNLSESAILAAAGAVLGLGLAQIGVSLLTRVEGGTLPSGSTVAVDAVALGFAGLVTVGSALLFTAIPAWFVARRRTSTLRSREGAGLARIREALVVTESALAAVVLVALVLALRSYHLVTQQDPGFEPSGLVTFQAMLPSARYSTDETERSFYGALRASLAEQPGVDAVGVMDALPLERGSIWPAFIDGVPFPPPGQEPQVHHRFASPGALEGLGVEVLAGRDFTAAEFRDGADVMIVDRLFAEQFWPGQDPIGRQARHFRDGPWLRVIGVVGSTAQRGLEDGLLPTTYAPRTDDGMHVIVRSSLPITELVPRIRSSVAAIDPGVPVETLRTGAMVLASDTADRRFEWMLLLAFGSVGLLLAAIGTYGSLSALVVQRQREIGVRRALGETGQSVVRRMLTRTVVLASLGLVFGFSASLALAEVLQSLVFAIPATDPLTYLTVALLMVGSALVAGLMPAARAASVSPVEAIRGEVH